MFCRTTWRRLLVFSILLWLNVITYTECRFVFFSVSLAGHNNGTGK